MNNDGSQKINLTSSDYKEEDPLFTADGSQIFFTSGDRDGNVEIYIMDIDGKNVKNLTNNSALDCGPTAQPEF